MENVRCHLLQSPQTVQQDFSWWKNPPDTSWHKSARNHRDGHFSMIFFVPNRSSRSKQINAPHPLSINYHVLSCSTVSAPGKVLVAGGYLVLDKPNVGVVLAATARFYTSVRWIEEQVSLYLYDGTNLSLQVRTVRRGYMLIFWTCSCVSPSETTRIVA